MNTCGDELILGIDVGTSSLKATVFDLRGTVLRSARSPYPVSTPAQNRAEQDPGDYIAALKDAVLRIVSDDPALGRRIRAVGLTGQWPTETLLDKNHRPLRPMITWADSRAESEAAEIAAAFPKDVLAGRLICRSPVSASMTPARLVWLSRHEPENAKNAAYYIGAKDFVGMFLTGEHVTDIWSARTLAMKNGGYYRKLLDFAGIRAEIMPPAVPWHTSRGTLSADAANAVGLCAGIPVSVGCDDGLATVLGSGVPSLAGIAFDSAGTSEIIGASVGDEKTEPDDRVTDIPISVTGGLPVRFGPTQSGGASLIWLTEKVLGIDLKEADALAETAEKGSLGMIFTPYISGERAPVWNPAATGSFCGINAECGKEHFVRSVMEGVAFSVRHVLSCCLGTGKSSSLRVCGGGSASRVWNQIKADVLGLPVELLSCPDAASLGAAITAAVCANFYGSADDAMASMVHVAETIIPDMRALAIYDELYNRYLTEAERFMK